MVFIPYLAIFIVLVVIKLITMNLIALVLGIFIISVLLYWRIGQHISDVSVKYELNSKSTTSTESSSDFIVTF